jgi:hypothetical protein
VQHNICNIFVSEVLYLVFTFSSVFFIFKSYLNDVSWQRKSTAFVIFYFCIYKVTCVFDGKRLKIVGSFPVVAVTNVFCAWA